MIYLDSGATSFRKPPQVARAMTWAMENCANPGRGGHRPAREGKGRGQRQAASRSADVKYLRRGLYSRANTTRHRMMLGSM